MDNSAAFSAFRQLCRQVGTACYFSNFSVQQLLVLEIVPPGLIPFLELTDVKWWPWKKFIFKTNHLLSCLGAKSNTHTAPREKSKVHSMRVCRTSQDLTWQLSHKTEQHRESLSLSIFFFFLSSHDSWEVSCKTRSFVSAISFSFVWGCNPCHSMSSSGPRCQIKLQLPTTAFNSSSFTCALQLWSCCEDAAKTLPKSRRENRTFQFRHLGRKHKASHE